MLTQLPRMLLAQKRGDYIRAMKIGRNVMGSASIKAAAFAGYTPTSHDVFVTTYSKSGTYWMLQIVTQIAWLGSAEFDHIHDVVPWPETPLPNMLRLQAPTWEDAPTKTRAIKTHVETQFLPYRPAAKYISVIRDPKDALISGFHFADAIMPGLKSIGLNRWLDAFITGDTPFGPWADHVASVWAWRNRSNVRLFVFRDMKRDLRKAVLDVADLMQVQLSEQQLAQVVKRSGFAHMKRQEAKFEPPSPARNSQIQLIRNGSAGESKTTLSAEQLACVDSEMKRQLQELGSDFPYDDYFPA